MESDTDGLTALTADMFEAGAKEPFEVVFKDGVIPLELVTLERLEKRRTPARAEPFSITFRGPGDRLIPQMNLTVRNATIGEHVFFSVPIGVDETGALYQVIFN